MVRAGVERKKIGMKGAIDLKGEAPEVPENVSRVLGDPRFIACNALNLPSR